MRAGSFAGEELPLALAFVREGHVDIEIVPDMPGLWTIRPAL